MADVDLTVAESAYVTLLDARHKPRNVAATPRFGRPARFKASVINTLVRLSLAPNKLAREAYGTLV
jgi:hypothetical protein